MPDVTPIPKTKRYRRKARTPVELKFYLDNVERRMRYAGYRCEAALPRVCTGEATAPHHVFPQRLGRDDSFECLRAVCVPCNQMIESMGVKSAEAIGMYSAFPLGIVDPDDAA